MNHMIVAAVLCIEAQGIKLDIPEEPPRYAIPDGKLRDRRLAIACTCKNYID